jgi:thiol-disulfide isomerase/thioredoxin
MKKLIFLFIVISSFTANAQVETVTTTGTITRTNASGTTTTKVNRTNSIDSNTVVKDSAGVRYAYGDWHKLILTGQYLLMNRPTDSVQEFTLVKKDAAAIARSKMFRPGPDETGLIKTGEKLDLFKAKDIAGYKIDPKELQGKVVVLNFWFINCSPCREEIPELNKIALSYANNPDIVFIAVALDNKDDLQKFLKDTPFAYHIVENGKEIAGRYKIEGYPTSIILDKEGIVKYHLMGYGPITLEYFKKAIEEVR